MKKVTVILSLVLTLISSNKVFSVSLGETVVPANDISNARSIRDNTLAPNSFIGGAAESVAKDVAKTMSEDTKRCYLIDNPGLRQVCLKGTGGSACYGIDNYELRQVCLKDAKGDACYTIGDYGLRQVCLQGTQTDACYAIQNYDMRQSCLSYNGSTTFWILMAGHGYSIK